MKTITKKNVTAKKSVAKKSVAKKVDKTVGRKARIATIIEKLQARMKVAVAKNTWREKKIAALKAKLKSL